MPPPSTNNGSHNIYGCMVDVTKLTPAQQQQHAVMLLEHYHELCNTNDPSSMFVSPPSIPNIELFSQSTISSLDSGSCDRCWGHVGPMDLKGKASRTAGKTIYTLLWNVMGYASSYEEGREDGGCCGKVDPVRILQH